MPARLPHRAPSALLCATKFGRSNYDVRIFSAYDLLWFLSSLPTPPSLLLLYKRWVVLKFQQLCLLLNCPLQQNTVWGTKVFFYFLKIFPADVLCHDGLQPRVLLMGAIVVTCFATFAAPSFLRIAQIPGALHVFDIQGSLIVSKHRRKSKFLDDFSLFRENWKNKWNWKQTHMLCSLHHQGLSSHCGKSLLDLIGNHNWIKSQIKSACMDMTAVRKTSSRSGHPIKDGSQQNLTETL